MTISINKGKSGHTILKINYLISDPSPSTRKLASVNRISYLEKEKIEFLKKSAWNFGTKLCISTFAID